MIDFEGLLFAAVKLLAVFMVLVVIGGLAAVIIFAPMPLLAKVILAIGATLISILITASVITLYTGV